MLGMSLQEYTPFPSLITKMILDTQFSVGLRIFKIHIFMLFPSLYCTHAFAQTHTCLAYLFLK